MLQEKQGRQRISCLETYNDRHRAYISGVKNNKNMECPSMRSSLEVAVLKQKKVGVSANFWTSKGPIQSAHRKEVQENGPTLTPI